MTRDEEYLYITARTSTRMDCWYRTRIGVYIGTWKWFGVWTLELDRISYEYQG